MGRQPVRIDLVTPIGENVQTQFLLEVVGREDAYGYCKPKPLPNSAMVGDWGYGS